MSTLYYESEQYPNELYHYGVLGMKWGQHKYSSQKNKIKRLSDKRDKIAEKKGVVSNGYLNKSKDLYLLKQKQKLTKAKLNNDSTEKTIAKDKIREAKGFKKNGVFTYNYNSNDVRKVYGYNLSNKDKTAIQIKEINQDTNRIKTNRIKKIASSAAIAIAPAAIASGVAYFNKNSDKIAINLQRNNVDIGKVNNFIKKHNAVVNQINRFAYKMKYQ